MRTRWCHACRTSILWDDRRNICADCEGAGRHALGILACIGVAVAAKEYAHVNALIAGHLGVPAGIRTRAWGEHRVHLQISIDEARAALLGYASVEAMREAERR